jgi:hypothetical protein
MEITPLIVIYKDELKAINEFFESKREHLSSKLGHMFHLNSSVFTAYVQLQHFSPRK